MKKDLERIDRNIESAKRRISANVPAPFRGVAYVLKQLPPGGRVAGLGLMVILLSIAVLKGLL